MPDLLIYHPGTGTVIPLSDEVYLVNTEFVDEYVLDLMTEGSSVREKDHKGYRIDNFNMGNLFYGSKGGEQGVTTVNLTIDNAYLTEVVTTTVGPVEVEPLGDDQQEWAIDNLYPHTGTGRRGEATYTVTITDSSDPALVGLTFEFA